MSINLLADVFGFKRPVKIPPEIEQRFNDESLCARCGLCCYGSVRYKGRLVIILDLPCKYLRKEENGRATCTVYPERHKIAPWCQTVNKESVQAGLFPNTCPYVQGIAGYEGKILLSKEKEKEFYRWLKRHFSDRSKPEYLSEECWQKFLEKIERADSK